MLLSPVSVCLRLNRLLRVDFCLSDSEFRLDFGSGRVECRYRLIAVRV